MQARVAFYAFEAIEWAKSAVRRQEGQSAVEYGVILALILAVCVVLIAALGTQINAKFQSVCTAVKGSACP